MYYNYYIPSLVRKEKCDVSGDNSSRDIMLRQIVRKLRQRLILYPLSSTPTAFTEPINGPLQGELYTTLLSCHAWWREQTWHHTDFLSCGTEPEYQISNPSFPFADAGGFHRSQIIL
jgi:hypothetical protein